MNLTSENTAIVLDSTSDFPEAKARERFDNIRVVPLHVLFGSEDILDHVGISGHDFYERLRSAPALPTTAQPKPGEFLRAYEDLARYDRIYSLHLSRELSGTYGSAVQAAGIFGADRVRLIDSETASLAVAMLALAIERRLARGTSDAEIEELIDRFKRDNGVVFTVGTLEYLQRGGAHRQGAGARRHPAECEADPVCRERRRRPGRPGPWPPEGARRVPSPLRGGNRRPPRAQGCDRARRRPGVGGGRLRARARVEAPGRDRAGGEPWRSRRHPRRPRLSRVLLVPGRLVVSVVVSVVGPRYGDVRVRGGVAPARVVDLAGVAVARVGAWRATAGEVRLRLDAPVPVNARVGSDRAVQVIDNLVSNGLRHAPEGPVVTVSVLRAAGGIVELHVAGEGPGMTAEQKERAFDRFWRSESGAGGSGLGLSIARRLVEVDGGTIELLDAQGGGREVVVCVPAG